MSSIVQQSSSVAPRYAKPSGVAHSTAASADWGITLLTAYLCFGQRLALPIGSVQLAPIFPLTFALFGYWLMKGTLRLQPQRAFWLMATLVGCTISYLVNQSNPLTSQKSFYYLILLCLPWAFVREQTAARTAFLSTHQSFMTVIAALGILQFVIQVAGFTVPDPLELLPSSMVMKDYYTHQPIFYGATIFKSNGVFCLEPSFYSKWVGMALVIELTYLRRPWALGLFASAMLPSFSGTGVLVLIGVLGVVVQRISANLMVGSLVVGALAIVFMPEGIRDAYLGRIDEFSKGGGSASSRFVAPYERLYDSMFEENSVIFGHGPGTVKVLENVYESWQAQDSQGGQRYGRETQVEAEAYGNTIVKAIYEYGLVFGLPLLIFFMFSFFQKTPSVPISIGAALIYTVLTGALLEPTTGYYCMTLGCLFHNDKPLRKRAVSAPEVLHGVTS